MNKEQKNKKFVEEFLHAVSTGDGKFLSNAYAENAKFWVAGSLPILSGHHNKKDFFDMLARSGRKSFPDGFSLKPTAMTAEGDRVAVEAQAFGHHSSGKTYENFFHLLLVVRDRKIHEWKEYMDTMHANDVLLSNGAIRNYD